MTFKTLSYSLILSLFILNHVGLKSENTVEQVTEILYIAVTQPDNTTYKNFGDLIEAVLTLVESDPEPVRTWLAPHNITLEQFVQSMQKAKAARNIAQVSMALMKLWPATPDKVKNVGLIKMQGNIRKWLAKS